MEPKNRKGQVSLPQGTLNATERFRVTIFNFFLPDFFPTADQLSQESGAVLRCLFSHFHHQREKPSIYQVQPEKCWGRIQMLQSGIP